MIQIRCASCETLYFIETSKIKREQDLLFRYAKCTHCGTSRNPNAKKDSRGIHKKVRITPAKRVIGECNECGDPVDNKKLNLCHRHYIQAWKKATKYNTVYMKNWRNSKKITT